MSQNAKSNSENLSAKRPLEIRGETPKAPLEAFEYLLLNFGFVDFFFLDSVIKSVLHQKQMNDTQYEDLKGHATLLHSRAPPRFSLIDNLKLFFCVTCV